MVAQSLRKSRREILADFPSLGPQSFDITSPMADSYNCAAYAAGDIQRVWDPDPVIGYWPSGVQRSRTIEAFCKAFETLGYTRADNASLEQGVEKIAFFQKNEKSQHVALQMENGMWTSKLGRGHDIYHVLEELEGEKYGIIKYIMKRKRG